MTRFADLGMPFPLFEAEVQEADGYRGFNTCFLCQREHVHCFKPDAVLIVCQSCATENELEVARDASSQVGGACMRCASPLPSGKGLVCYTCLRAGRAWFTKDTELGLVTRQHALAGMTHGKPGLDHPEFELVTQEEDGWVAARVPSKHLLELILTPDYSTWQGAIWLFCCRAPMVYTGAWTLATFTERAPDGNGRSYLDEILHPPENLGDLLWKGVFPSPGIYVFHCPRCGKLRGDFDYD